jgi:kinesin family member 18/19
MIANISPSILSIEETLNTLKYANRAKNIKVSLKKNVVEQTDYHISKYDEVVNALKSEIEQLKFQLAKKNVDSGSHSADSSFINVSPRNEIIEKIEKVQKEITSHFTEEIKLRKDIIELERKVENNKIEIAEKEYQLYKVLNSQNKEQENIKKSITQLITENENHSKMINDKYIKQSEIMKNRSAHQRSITNITQENPSGGKILMQTYQYYSTLLDNMTLEHRKNVNLSEMKRKEFQINKLLDQIKARDEVILNANNEIKKKKISFKYNSEKLKSLEEIDLEPLRLPVIVNNSQNFVPSRENKVRSKSPSPQHSKEIFILIIIF